VNLPVVVECSRSHDFGDIPLEIGIHIDGAVVYDETVPVKDASAILDGDMPVVCHGAEIVELCALFNEQLAAGIYGKMP
jgi:hypothetical protein